MTKVTDEMMERANKCPHAWTWHNPGRRVCMACGIGENVDPHNFARPAECRHEWVTGAFATATFCRHCGVDKVNACTHQWESIGKRRECIYCGLGEMAPANPPYQSAETLRTIADEMDTLEFMYDELKRAVRDAMGPQRCICEMRSGNPMVKDHDLHCKILRAQLECFK